MKYDLSKPYMTEAERQDFTRRRDSGEISVFRVKKCAACDADVPPGKTYCCKREYDQRLDKLRSIVAEVEKIVADRWQEKRTRKVKGNGRSKET